MKLKIYKHTSIKTPIDDDILKIPVYFKSQFVKKYINEPIVYDVENTNKDYKDDTLFKSNEGKYDVVMFIYEQGTFPIYGNCSPYSNILIKIYVSVNPVEDKIDYSWKAMCHEILHAIWFMQKQKTGQNIPNLLDTYFHNDDPYFVGGNFEQQLKAMQPYYQTGYIYFKPSEIVGLKPELVLMLDKARGIAGVPFKITSGFRTVAQNKAVGGVANSSHLRGIACDIACTTMTRQKILLGLLTCGVPVFLEDCPQHIHVDIDSSIHSLGDAIISQNG